MATDTEVKDVSFSLNMYDRDGDCCDTCILIHIDNNTSIRFNDMNQYKEFMISLQRIRAEIDAAQG